MSQDTAKESRITLKTIYSQLGEISELLDKPIDQLEYLNNGSESKEKSEHGPESNDSTITFAMLENRVNSLRRKVSAIAKNCNHLTGQ